MLHYHIKNDELLHKLTALKPFQGKEEKRYYLCGVYLHLVDGKLTGVATNGQILCTATINAEPGADNAEALSFILPRQSVDHLLKMAKDRKDGAVLVDIADSRATFDFGDFKYETKAIDATFPDYAKLIPQNTNSGWGINASYLKSAIAALGSNAIDIAATDEPYAPKVLSSQDAEGITVVMMPMRN